MNKPCRSSDIRGIIRMQHFSDGYWERLKPYLAGTTALEVGCGNGARTREIAPYFKSLTGMDPGPLLIAEARRNNCLDNLVFQAGSAEDLPFPDGSFEVVLFPLSFHHIAPELMRPAIAEAVRVLTPKGSVIFIEPENEGSFIAAELLFGCCDGDERRQKALAYYTMLTSEQLTEVCEMRGESFFQFDSEQDFLENIAWLEGTRSALADYLACHDYRLSAKRRINVFRKAA